MDNKKIRNLVKQNFLHTFFEKKEGYQEKEVNGFILINQFDKNTGKWEVAIFSKESFKNRKNFLQSFQGRELRGLPLQ